MPRDDLILFLDCEMTGAGDENDLIEIGCVLLDSVTLNEVSSFDSVIKPSSDGFLALLANPVVSRMHTENGLVADIRAKNAPERTAVDSALCEWLNSAAPDLQRAKTHIPYGGSGVSHFDRKFITRQLPRFDKRITFWAYDVGAVRRTFELAGAPWYSEKGNKSHRALDDARGHANEFRFAVSFLRGD